ncbi:hypothetical protein BSTEL_0949 [Bifidobacterium stellenboschense]|uniref:Uncharacterized protein n=1 Tax=Bifidobacterium stellenboschense TaxID=762211 RepID=A0A087E0C4_9BIFI|nr:hypothetical protein BSTEL_0949 [Bifidobacterium stellenboschense]
MDMRELHAATGFSVACACGVTHNIDVFMDGGTCP